MKIIASVKEVNEKITYYIRNDDLFNILCIDRGGRRRMANEFIHESTKFFTSIEI